MNQPAPYRKPSARALLAASLTGALTVALAGSASAQVIYGFNANAEGWQIGSRPNGGGNLNVPPNGPLSIPGAASLAYVGTGGNPGGHLQATDTGAGDMILFRNFAGGADFTGLLGGTFQFDAIQLAATTSNYAPFGRVRFFRTDSGGTVDVAGFDIVPASTQPPASWTTYSGNLTAANLTVSSSSGFSLTQIFSNITRIEITVEAVSGFEETIGVDNIIVRAAAPEPGILALVLTALPVAGMVLRRARRP